jgi:hypothetical protein
MVAAKAADWKQKNKNTEQKKSLGLPDMVQVQLKGLKWGE